jgi:putative ABC transport system permease protein
VLSAVRLLNLRWLRRHPLRTVLAVVAVVAGTSLALSVVVVSQSVSASVVDFSRAVAGPAPLRVIGADNAGGIPQGEGARVAAVPGVAFAVPMVQTVTLVQQRPVVGSPRIQVVVLGVDCRVQALVGRFGCGPGVFSAASGPVVSDRIDTHGWMLTGTGTLPLAGSVVLPALDGLNGGRVVVLPLARAQSLFSRPGRLDVIYVGPSPGVPLPVLRARLGRVVGAGAVLSASDPPPQVVGSLKTIVSLLGLMAILVIGISAVLIYNVISLSLEERRRHHALVAAVGAPPSSLVAGPLAEAGVIGAVGGLAGAAAALVVASPIAANMSAFTESAVGVPVRLHASPLTFIVGAVLGVVLAVVATLRPVRRSLRLDVTAELSGRERAAESAPGVAARRLVVPVALLVVALVGCRVAESHGGLYPWQPTLAQLSFLGVTLASVLACAAAAPVLVRALQRRSDGRGPLPRLGLANLARHPGRTGVMAVAVASTTGVAFITASWSRSVHDAIAQQIAAANPDAVGVHGPQTNQGVSGGLPPGVPARLAAVPGVARVSYGAGVLTGNTPGGLAGVIGVDQLVDGYGLIEGSDAPGPFFRGAAMVGPGIARSQRLRPGSRVTLDVPGGVVRLPVEGIWQDGDWAGSNVTVPMPLFQRLWGPIPVGGAALTPAPGVSSTELAARVWAAHIWPDLSVVTPAQNLRQADRNVSGQLQPFWVLQRVLTLVAFVAVLSTLLLAGIQRRREMGVLAAVGLRPADLGGMVLAEAALVAAVGVVLGAAFGLVGLFGFVQTGPVIIGYRDPFRLDVASFVVYGLIATVVALAASALPSWRARTLPVLEALQYE